MSKIMETNVPVSARALNAGGLQCLVEGITQCGNRIPSSAWALKERLLGRQDPKCWVASVRQRSICGSKSGAIGTTLDLSNFVCRICKIGRASCRERV